MQTGTTGNVTNIQKIIRTTIETRQDDLDTHEVNITYMEEDPYGSGTILPCNHYHSENSGCLCNCHNTQDG